jgi:ribosomal protein S18 acetylase RimI-like enzyme
VLIATTTLAARIERAEADTAAAFARSAAGGADVLTHAIGGTVAVYGGPGKPFNKVAGLGFAPLDEADIERLEALYDARGGEIRVEQSSLADPAVASMLTRRGYALIGYENVLGLPLTADVVSAFAREREAARTHGIEIAAAAPAETGTWIRTATEGFLTPDRFDGPPPTETFARESIERIFEDFSGAPGCAFYLARRGGAIAGSGALRIVDGLAQLAGASTLPPHRRRGVQSALMRARLVEASAAGCDLAVVTTEPASKSQENVQRAGFALLYVRAILVRPPR